MQTDQKRHNETMQFLAWIDECRKPCPHSLPDSHLLFTARLHRNTLWQYRNGKRYVSSEVIRLFELMLGARFHFNPRAKPPKPTNCIPAWPVYSAAGMTMTARQWAKYLGYSGSLVRTKIANGTFRAWVEGMIRK